jgi:diphthine-ammonia ligase
LGDHILRIALVSGGKESFYAAMKIGNIDYLLILIYEFPRPSPHLLNLEKTIETLTYFNKPIIIKKLDKGKEKEETIALVRKLGTKEVIAGDVYIEDHLKYMESIANSIGAKLYEPLWGKDPEEILHKEINEGIRPLIIGTQQNLKPWLGTIINPNNIEEFIKYTKQINIDPLGEKGEYHTLVINSPLHNKELKYKIIETLTFNEYYILKLV